MKNKAYEKSIKREILSSKGRFISILTIIFLGVAFYSGIKSSGPDLKHSINEYFKTQNLMDSKIVSTIGFNENDLKLLEDNDKILDYYATHTIDINMTNTNSVVKFMEYDPKSNKEINKFVIREGRLPKNSGEIALDETFLKQGRSLKVGDTYTIETDEDLGDCLNKKTFKIVGFVQSPMYIDNMSRGTTNVGKGSIDYFALLNSSDISMDVYTEIYVRFKNVEDIGGYSDEYKNIMEVNKKYLEELFSNRVIDRIEEVKLQATGEINEAYDKIEAGEQKLKDAQEEIENGKLELLKGKIEYEKALRQLEKEIKDGKDQLVEGHKRLEEGQKEFEKQRAVIEEGEKQLIISKEQLDNVKQEFLNQGIDPTKDTLEYKSQIGELNELIKTYKSLSNDIKETVTIIGDNNGIPNDKIKYWKNIISDESLGLSGLNDLIDTLELNPLNKSLALNISKEIDNASESLYTNKMRLETLVGGIIKYQQGTKIYEEQYHLINQGKLQLKNAQDELDKGKEDLLKGKNELEEGKKKGQLELNKAKTELVNGEKEILDGEKEIKKSKEKLSNGREEIANAKEKLKKLDDSKYYLFDRNDNQGYSTYKGSIDSLDKIASVFPVFFFLVAALICLTTMTRMVEENRTEIGTLKALGYTDFEVGKKFIIYAALASILGCVMGIIIGSILLPYIINIAYSATFTLPKVTINFYPSYIFQSLVASVFCTIGAAIIVLREELRDNPSNLMRPKAPKLGKKILLERVTPLWSRMNFNQKVTFRNLFRYKQRMLMTVLGISGCMAMLVAGISLEQSNSSYLDIQFNKLINFDAIVVFDEKATENEKIKYEQSLNNLEGYDSSLNIYQESVTFSKENISKQTATMYVPQNKQELNQYLLLDDRVSKEKYQLSDDGVIINEKLAKLLDVSVGDNIILQDSNSNPYEVNVENIVENYTGHYVYLSPNYYKKIFDTEPIYNAQLLKLNSQVEDENIVAEELLENEKVINVTLTSKIRSMSESADLGLVIIVIIIASGSLAFVVLYNLININVSERIREISTIKVLGFHDNEVDMYIFRENIILTILGILLGTIIGKILYVFLVSTAEMDNMMMIPTVNTSSYIISSVITMIFAILVMIMMHKKLKNINMIDALKSVE